MILPSGGYGTLLIGDAGLARQMISTFAADGLMTVEVAWDEPGIWLGPPARTLACRFATVARWIYDNLHDHAGLFAAQGTSGAASQVAFGLAHYGLGDILALANLGSGPPNCPLCSSNRRHPAEPLLAGPPRSVPRVAQLNYPSTAVRVFLGDSEPTPEIIADARTYFRAITSTKSMTTVSGTGHHIEETRNGINAYIQSVRAALR